jgi:hypothetical protein
MRRGGIGQKFDRRTSKWFADKEVSLRNGKKSHCGSYSFQSDAPTQGKPAHQGRHDDCVRGAESRNKSFDRREEERIGL